jgi:syntaxin-binding protein 1
MDVDESTTSLKGYSRKRILEDMIGGSK